MSTPPMWIWKSLVNTHIFLYRLSGGRIGSHRLNLPVLLLTTKGRKTGINRVSPLGFIPYRNGYVIIGSNGGLDKHPAWYFNLLEDEKAEIQVNCTSLKVEAELLRGEERQKVWEGLIVSSPSYENYRLQTKREIPLMLLRPTA